LLKLRKLKKRWRKRSGHSAWLAELADALISAILVFMTGGAFVGIAYQPFIFYMIGLTVVAGTPCCAACSARINSN
jgi:putative inorganic carbon (HCO3(-)) transporter